ncbi:MAG: hypothetical protein MI924_37005 [Chloroflexales bacterium]|nr:hypothetical protein [Chloroflexales bacterium]
MIRSWQWRDSDFIGGMILILALVGGCWLLFYIPMALFSFGVNPVSRDYPPSEGEILVVSVMFMLITGVGALLHGLLLRWYLRAGHFFTAHWAVMHTLVWTLTFLLLYYRPSGITHTSIAVLCGGVIGFLQGLTLTLYCNRALWLVVLHPLAFVLASYIFTSYWSTNFWLRALGALGVYGLLSGMSFIVVLKNAPPAPPATGSRPHRRKVTLWALILVEGLGLIALLLVISDWRRAWYLQGPQAPVYATAAEVIRETFGGVRRSSENEVYALVLRFPPPTDYGSQTQIVVLEDYSKAYLDPVDTQFFAFKTIALSPDQAMQLEAVRRAWCANPPQEAHPKATATSYAIGVRCRELDTIKGFQLPADSIPVAVRALIQAFE